MKHLLIPLVIPALLLAAPVLGADLIVNEQAVPFNDTPSVYDWTGPYIGIDVGVAFGIPDFAPTDDGSGCDWWCKNDWPTPDPLNDNNNDFLPFAGIEAGFNYQLDNNLVVGIEGDIQASGFNRHHNDETTEPLVIPTSFDMTPDLDFWGTLRGRVGVAMDRTLIYATGGLAFGHTNLDNMWWLPDGFNTDETRFGYAIGAGIEQAVTDNVSVKAEYLFVNLGDLGDTMPFDDGTFHSDLSFSAVRAGLNFKF